MKSRTYHAFTGYLHLLGQGSRPDSSRRLNSSAPVEHGCAGKGQGLGLRNTPNRSSGLMKGGAIQNSKRWVCNMLR